MSTVEEILNGREMNDMLSRMVNEQSEPHIIINTDRSVIVPDELKTIAVQHDHNIKTVTFDCPRFWDGHDLSVMQIYVTYMRPDGKSGKYPVDNIRVDDTNTDLIHFEWTITKNFTECKGSAKFLVCGCVVDSQGHEDLHWNSFLNDDLYIAEGLECTDDITEMYPDEITAILTRINNLEKDFADIKFEETDPTVHAWAKQPEKPTYTAEEVGALPESTKIPTKTSELENDSGFMTGYTETDPTVPAWAKRPEKPTYTAEEIGAANREHAHSYNDLRDKPTIPSIPESLPANGGNADTLGGKTVEEIKQDAEESIMAAVEAEVMGIYVTPQMFGAVGDGVSDDTAAFKAALDASDNVFIPIGRYLISEPIRVEQGKTLHGAGVNSKLIYEGTGNFILLSAFARFGRLSIRVQSDASLKDLIAVNEVSLANVTGLRSGNVGIVVGYLIIEYDDADYTDSAVVDLTLKGAYGSRNQTGYYGVSLDHVYVIGNPTLGYSIRGYTKNDCWITGITLNEFIVNGCRWSLFMHDSDSNFTNLHETKGIDHITLNRCQHQCGTTSKGFFFLRKQTNAQFTNCVAWDWHYAEGDFNNRPYWFAHDRLDNVSAKVDINNGNLTGEKFGFIYADGTTKLLHYWDHYILTHNIGVREVLEDGLPRQMALGNNSIKATCIFRDTSSNIMSNGAYYFLRFKFVDGRHMSEDVTVFLHPTVPYVVADRWDTSHKMGYTLINGVFSLYIYSNSNKQYGYLINEAISNNSMSYSGMAISNNYHKTINTWGLPVEERYLTSIPDDIVEITDIRTTFVTKTELENKRYLTDYTESDPTVPAWAKQPEKPSYTAQEVGALPNTIKIPTKTSELENDSGYITDYAETDPTVPAWAKQPEKPTYTAAEVGADESGTAESKMTVHNTSEESHNDIRLLISGLTSRLNAIADSDDDTLNQLSEIVTYIKNNKSLIDEVTTSKINVSDIIDNLRTSSSDKPLSAKQGVALKALIDAIVMPTKTSQLTNDSGFITGYTETDPTVPAWAKQSNKPSYTAEEVGALPESTKIPTKTSELENDSGFMTSVPVSSVNGKTGAVSLSASDVNARPNTWTPNASDVGAVPITETLTMVGIDVDGNSHTWTVYGKVVQ